MVCNKCGYEWHGVAEDSCPACGAQGESAMGEDLYARGVTAEREMKYKTAIRCYASAADMGVPCAAYAVCRCMEKSGTRQANPANYEFWLMTAARTDAIAALAYAKYLERAGDEHSSLRYLRQAADMGHEGAAFKMARYYTRHGNKPAARYYLKKVSGVGAWFLRLFIGRKPECEPHTPELPDNSVELYTVGNYAMELELPHIAYTYFEQAAKASYLPAIEIAAQMCMKGRGVARDEEQAQKYLTELGEAGKTKAYIQLGDYYSNGVIGGAPNPVAAAQAYRLAAEAGDADAMLLFGDCLCDGNGILRDARQAIEWYNRAAQAGAEEGKRRAAHVMEEAQRLFARGERSLKDGDVATAIATLEQAATGGSAEAYCLLGDCYLKGNGVHASPKRAAEYYRMAAAEGNLRGMYRLGILYRMNMGVRYDAAFAKRLLEAALRGGYLAAKEQLESMREEKQKFLAQKMYATSCVAYHRGDHEKAAKYRAVATKMGNGRAAYLLGCMYDCGDGVEKDTARAHELYDRALALGFDGRARDYLRKYLHNLPR